MLSSRDLEDCVKVRQSTFRLKRTELYFLSLLIPKPRQGHLKFFEMIQSAKFTGFFTFWSTDIESSIKFSSFRRNNNSY